ncbi:MAG: 2OG-Fe(II) oxygenase [Gammaproteobacteria bacterium]|nr:MAG: 2OG-Fe(II) oxygenase [Gammaproteobacteria bacterium]
MMNLLLNKLKKGDYSMINNTLTYQTPHNQENYIIQTNRLYENDLLQLFNKEILAIRIPDYYPLALCELSKQRLLQNGIQHYINAPSIGRNGMAFYETENDPEKIEQYYYRSRVNIEQIRQIFHPNFSPLDKLRLELQEAWASGANIENIHDRKMFVGLCRLLEPNVDFLPHQDIFHLDSKDNIRARSLKSQVAANIYLDIGNEGGEIDLWSYGFNDNIYPEMLDENSYGMSRSKLSAPTLSIKPKVGELVLFNGRNLHAVRPSKTVRISIACFIGYRGKEYPLTYWS